jgi:PadR family transcriptional regulator, regulatory protein AphA
MTGVRRDGAKPLSVSSYAILGLLASGPNSAYQLTRQMDRSLRFFWPRAASKLYEAPKALVARGLASASADTVGRRPRTVYSITPSGRRALRRWLSAGQPNALALESEAVLRVWLAHHGSKPALLDAIDAVREQAQTTLARGAEIATEHLEHGPPPERAHVNALVFRFLWDFNQMLVRWADWAEAEVSPWTDVSPSPDKQRRTLEVLSEALQQRGATAARD